MTEGTKLLCVGGAIVVVVGHNGYQVRKLNTGGHNGHQVRKLNIGGQALLSDCEKRGQQQHLGSMLAWTRKQHQCTCVCTNKHAPKLYIRCLLQQHSMTPKNTPAGLLFGLLFDSDHGGVDVILDTIH